MRSINLFWKNIDENTGYMERVELPDGSVIEFDKENNYIDYAPLVEYIGTPCIFYLDNLPQWQQLLDSVSDNERGQKTLLFVLNE